LITDPEQKSRIAKLSELLELMAEEMAFLMPDRDTGLLPLNGYLMDLEDMTGTGLSGAWAGGVTVVRRWIDEILDGTGKFSIESIERLTGWHDWMTRLVVALEEGEPEPELPQVWKATRTALATRSDGFKEGRRGQTVGAASNRESEPSIIPNLSDDLELLREFHSESLELLQSIEQGLLVLEENPADGKTIDSIFRAFHTFKGGAGFLHLDAMRDLAHELESLLDAVRRSELPINSFVIDLVLAGADSLNQFTAGIGQQLQNPKFHGSITVPTADLLRRLKSVLQDGVPRQTEVTPGLKQQPAGVQESQSSPETFSARLTLQVDASPQFVSPDMDIQESSVTGQVPEFQEESLGNLNPAQVKIRAPERTEETSAIGSRGGGISSFVKLDTAKLDNLVDLVGELVIAQSMVVQNPDVSKIASLPLARALRQLSRITTELQRNALSLRMVPVRGTFNKMFRLVRDLAVQEQKDVHLEMSGEDTELDRNIVEKLGDALIHMVRNSIDHGIEPPAERLSRGKPSQGTIRLSASHQRGGIVIRIEDDGRGLNRDTILAKALDGGWIMPNAVPSDSDIFSLIFLPGFSTAQRITGVSGRGVGMDVVKRNIEMLRGSIETRSELGEWTRFTILLPLTLAIIDGLLVGIGEERYVIPILSVRESFRPRRGMVTTVHGQGEIVCIRGKQIPILRLGEFLETPHASRSLEDGIIVVVESGDTTRGLFVDALIGKQEVVIKSLSETLRGQSLLVGAAVLADGWVGLILDVDTLVRLSNPERIPSRVAAFPNP